MRLYFATALCFSLFSASNSSYAACEKPLDCYQAAIELIKKRSDEIDHLKRSINSQHDEIRKLRDSLALFNSAIVGFNRTECPNNWVEYKPAYGRFLRGIDKSGNKIDPSGRREPGKVQGHAFHEHSHNVNGYRSTKHAHKDGGSEFSGLWVQHSKGVRDTSTVLAGGPETRPVNVAVLFCIKQ